MNYEEKYKNALERAKKLYEQGTITECLNYIFPELKESKDEMIMNQIISFLKEFEHDHYRSLDFSSWLAWLEKQGEKPKGKSALEAIKEEKIDNANRVEPKFKIGDWITDGEALLCISKFEIDYGYELKAIDGEVFHFVSSDLVDTSYHLWTIADAKPGDVLASKNGDDILIFRNLDTATSFSSYYNLRGKGELGWSNMSFIPATKEQRDILFTKMKEAGYEWNAEKKELKTLKE